MGQAPARQRQHLFAPPPAGRLYAIVDVDACAAAGRTPIDVARAFLSGGRRVAATALQALASGPFLDLANSVLESAQSAGATLIVNDRADSPRSPARTVSTSDRTISRRSTHDRRRQRGRFSACPRTRDTQWESAIREPISYLAIGPAFGTGTKETGYEAVGLEMVAGAARAASAARTAGRRDRRHHARQRRLPSSRPARRRWR